MLSGPAHHLMLAAILFATGLTGVIVRRNILVVYMSLELMLTAATLGLVTFAKANDAMDSNLFVFFIITVAAAEVAVGLALIVALFRKRGTVNADELTTLKH